MNKDTLINLRTSKALKDDFQSIVEREGFTMSEVLEASMLDIVHRNIVPINIRSKIRKERKPIISIPFIKKCIEEAVLEMNNNKIKGISLFGSYSRGTATQSSDVDLLLETDSDFSLFDLADLQNKLENKLGKEVDLVTNTDDEYFMHVIQRDKIQLYERRT